MEQEVMTEIVSFRVTPEQRQQLEAAARASGMKARDWCRQVVLEKAGDAHPMTKNERLMYEELSRVRYLVGIGFRLIAHDQLQPEEWEKARTIAERQAAKIADQLIASSRTMAQDSDQRDGNLEP